MTGSSLHRVRRAAVGLLLAACALVPLIAFDDARVGRSAAVVGVYLVLALIELVPPFVPALFLMVMVPLALGAYGPEYRLGAVLRWAADPVLALFAGGLALGLAAQLHGIDRAIAAAVLRVARGRQRTLLALVLAGTALMSMWMSNIAAAAMVLAALRPLLAHGAVHAGFRRALLLGVAMGANLGGMGTPIGSGPNALAIAAAAPSAPISFLLWMRFALPLVLGMLLVGFVFIALRYRVRGGFEPVPLAAPTLTRQSLAVVAIFAACVIAWLCEPLHGVPSALVALAAALLLFGSGVVGRERLGSLDWSTLGLIAGGIMLGRLLEHTPLFDLVARSDWTHLPGTVRLGALVLLSATLASVMSNTATAALLIPLAMALEPRPSSAVLIAIAASFGMPFAISTPPNAMAYGEGGLGAGDLAAVGLLLMAIGCALVTFTGSAALHALGLP